MATLGDMIEETLLGLEGFIEDQDVFGTLRASVVAANMGFTVDGSVFPDGSGFSPGIVEVGDELVYVQAIDRATGAFSGVLRGWRGTVARDWPAGTLVRNNPRFPRLSVKRALNDTLESLYPEVYAVKSTEFTCRPGRIAYELPADSREVIDVSWSVPGISRKWQQVRRWSFDRNAASSFASGRSVEIVDSLPGRPIQVTYEAEPTVLKNLADDFAAVSGLPSWCRELVVLGAKWRLLSDIENGDVGTRTAEQRAINGQVPMGSGANQAKVMGQMFALRKQEASHRLREENDVRVRYTG